MNAETYLLPSANYILPKLTFFMLAFEISIFNALMLQLHMVTARHSLIINWLTVKVEKINKKVMNWNQNHFSARKRADDFCQFSSVTIWKRLFIK